MRMVKTQRVGRRGIRKGLDRAVARGLGSGIPSGRGQVGRVLQVIGEAAGGGDLHGERIARLLWRLEHWHRRRRSHDLDVKRLLLGPHGGRIISRHLAVDRVKVSRRVGFDHQAERPEVWVRGRTPRHIEVRAGPREVVGPSWVRRVGQVVAAVWTPPASRLLRFSA